MSIDKVEANRQYGPCDVPILGTYTYNAAQAVQITNYGRLVVANWFDLPFEIDDGMGNLAPANTGAAIHYWGDDV